MDISVVIPVLNEAENLLEFVPRLRRCLDDSGLKSEIIAVDGGSTDKTVETAESLQIRVMNESGTGFGAALRRGIEESQGRLVVTMDGDGSHDPEYLPDMVEASRQADVVIASRYVSGGGTVCSILRNRLSRTLNWWLTHLLSLPVSDISGGFRLYRKDVFSEFETTGRDFNIQAEILINAWAKGFRVLEVPYEYRPRSHGISKVRVWKYGWAFFRTGLSLRRLRNTVYFADYDHRARYSRIPLQRWWHWKRNRLIEAFLEGRNPAADIGCGSGQFVLSGRPVGIDMDIAKARYSRNNGGRTLCGNASAIPLRDQTFEEVVCSEVVEHIERDRVFGELARIMKSGGNLVVTTPDYSSPVWRTIEWFYERLLPGAYAQQHITRYDRNSLKKCLETAGLDVLATATMAASIIAVKARKR